MEIIDERTKNRITLENVACGALFIDDERDVCMRTDECSEDCDLIKCVSLKDGFQFEKWKKTKVEAVTGKLYIED